MSKELHTANKTRWTVFSIAWMRSFWYHFIYIRSDVFDIFISLLWIFFFKFSFRKFFNLSWVFGKIMNEWVCVSVSISSEILNLVLSSLQSFFYLLRKEVLWRGSTSCLIVRCADTQTQAQSTYFMRAVLFSLWYHQNSSSMFH